MAVIYEIGSNTLPQINDYLQEFLPEGLFFEEQIPAETPNLLCEEIRGKGKHYFSYFVREEASGFADDDEYTSESF